MMASMTIIIKNTAATATTTYNHIEVGSCPVVAVVSTIGPLGEGKVTSGGEGVCVGVRGGGVEEEGE